MEENIEKLMYGHILNKNIHTAGETLQEALRLDIHQTYVNHTNFVSSSLHQIELRDTARNCKSA